MANTQDWTAFSGGCPLPVSSTLIVDCCGASIIDNNGFNFVHNLGDVDETDYTCTTVNLTCFSKQSNVPCGGAIWIPATKLWRYAIALPCACVASILTAAGFAIDLSSIIGTPRLGLGIKIRGDSTCDSAELYGGIVDFIDNTIKIVAWQNTSLTTYDVILSSTSFAELALRTGLVSLSLTGERSFPNLDCTNADIIFSANYSPTNTSVSSRITPAAQVPCDSNHIGVGVVVVGENTVSSADSSAIMLKDPISAYSLIANVNQGGG